MAKAANTNAQGAIHQINHLAETSELQLITVMEEMKDTYVKTVVAAEVVSSHIAVLEVNTQSAIDTLDNKVATIYNEVDVNLDRVQTTVRGKCACVERVVRENSMTVRALRETGTARLQQSWC